MTDTPATPTTEVVRCPNDVASTYRSGNKAWCPRCRVWVNVIEDGVLDVHYLYQYGDVQGGE